MKKMFALEGNEEDTSTLPEGPEIDAEASNELEKDFQQESFDVTTALEHQSRLLIAIESINSLIEEKKQAQVDGRMISFESYKLVQQAILANTDSQGSLLFDPNASIEALESISDKLNKSFWSNLGRVGTKLLDTIQRFASVLEFQSNRINMYRRLLVGKDKVKQKISVRATRYFQCGEPAKPIKNIKEYIKELEYAEHVISETCVMLEKLIDKDLFALLKWLGSGVTGNADYFIKDRVGILNESLIELSKSTRMENKKVGTTTIYQTPNMLGLFQLTFTLPNTKIDDYRLADIHKYDLHLDKEGKFVNDVRSGDVIELEVSSKDLDEILNISEKIVTSAKKISGFKGRLGTILDMLYALVLHKNIMAFNPVGLFVFFTSLFTASGALVHKIFGIVGGATAGIYNTAFGNVKGAVSLVEKYLEHYKE